ncbi:MAG: hypothetical protein FWG14_07100 [Peptococcaceae bacterium]|nr:hypothetical protein [Peptococcaceae bacterium]
MRPKKLRQLIILNGTIVVVNIGLFSKMFVGLALVGGTALSLALGWTVVVMSACVFVWGNSRLLKKEAPHSLTHLAQGISTLSQCQEVLEESRGVKTFSDRINENIGQIKRFQKKKAAIDEILLQKFSAEGLSYKRFLGVLNEVENVLCLNIRSILHKISAFDETDYRELCHKGVHSDLLNREKMEIYNEYISFVDQATRNNEGVLLKLDKMLLEVSRYNSLAGGDIENMPAIREMDELIKNAELYR